MGFQRGFFNFCPDYSNVNLPINDDEYSPIIKVFKFGKNLGRNKKNHIGDLYWKPILDIGIPIYIGVQMSNIIISDFLIGYRC